MGSSIEATELSFTTLQEVVKETVSGGAVTSIDITGLDLEGDGGMYIINAYLSNAAAADNNISMYANGDTTATNYYSQVWGIDHATFSGARANTGVAMSVQNAHDVPFQGFIGKIASCIPGAVFTTTRQMGSVVKVVQYGWNPASATTNVTQLTFTGSQANGIDNGSFIQILKVV